ncbi:MAG: hypothetical protein Q9203_005868 [Teloschistes exilis]
MSEKDPDYRIIRVNPAAAEVPSLPVRRSARIQQLFAKKNEPKDPLEKNQDIANPFSLPQVSAHTAPALESPPDGPLRFFDFPTEVRNMIYRYIVSFPNGVVKAKKLSPRLNIFLANRRFLNEASTFFYATNTFIFYSCYVRRGDNPFGPRLDRIQRCLLHLSSTQNHRNAFLYWFNKNFVDALTLNYKLQYLIIRVTIGQLDTLEPLLLLSNIGYAQVDVGQPPPTCPGTGIPAHPNLARNERMGLYRDRWEGNGGGCKSVSQQMLERMLMCDVRPRSQEETEKMDEFSIVPLDYVSEPALVVGLEPGRLSEVKEQGGWRRNFELYDFLGIKRHRWIRCGVR